jgi:NitT/TauT family transport system ATP-binding protein
VNLNGERAKAGIGYVPQEPNLLPWRTAFQNAAVGLEIAGRERGKPERDRVLELFARFGLSGKRDGLPRELSGGMRQRVAVIRCLAAQPRMIFMDEPFSAVDFVTRLEADTMLRYFCRDLGATVVVVTHNIEEAIFLGDRVVVMGGAPGRIVAEFDTTLSVAHDNAVNYRAAPEFGRLFRDIWKTLEG